MAIKGIFFDAANVFYERTEPTNRIIRQWLTAHGYPHQLSEVHRARQRALLDQASGGHISPNVYWDSVLTLYGVNAAPERATLIEKILAHVHIVRAIPGGRETLISLKQRGFLLGIITDSIYPVAWKMRWLESVAVSDLIDMVTCSSALGVHKPDPAIYLHAVQRAKLAIAESAFVGHDTAELAGAQSVGLATVAVLYDPEARADYYAETLPDLLNVPIFRSSVEKGQMT
jgi:FMN phosphatase YigB (HAD superfamily)